jgi:hypothetical protein
MNEHTPWQIYAIFISSTFTDMQVERDHLKNVISAETKAVLLKMVREGSDVGCHRLPEKVEAIPANRNNTEILNLITETQ